ncbi:hypothetical protein B0A54_06828 [Friedmanniomyces endolithicus]|uniref:Gfd2/YDR514C-like C-terminal domain-containing protein n=1 Tax=Friedmanniomyces endolithicus TaxID=329885 RepID=A0A4V5N866_9PEZI|nr:hypothetical protein LTS09_008398 [Friedmanniomyces endolithicus]TKA42379.1 hypothetical protein B0A54_06828 [Friedmanniomyces endolithicus]
MGKHRVQPPGDNRALHSVQEILGLRPRTTTTAKLGRPVFICIDCEAFEHDQSKITEIGIAVLDTRDCTDLWPGANEKQWIGKIQYAHYRPVQYAELRNKNFIRGCADGFNFGSTAWINLDDAKPILRRIFQYPSQLHQAGDLSTPLWDCRCETVFVAHGASNDTAFLRKLDFDMESDGQVSLIVDTQRVAGGSKRAAIGLQRLLSSMGVQPVNLHNAGNDAAYTLQSMVMMACRDFANPGTVAAGLARFRGKMPPVQHIAFKAPEIWMGTAVQPGVGPPAVGQRQKNTSQDPTSVRIRAERRRRKRVARARAKADPKGAAAAAAAKKRRPWSFKPRRDAT